MTGVNGIFRNLLGSHPREGMNDSQQRLKKQFTYEELSPLIIKPALKMPSAFEQKGIKKQHYSVNSLRETHFAECSVILRCLHQNKLSSRRAWDVFSFKLGFPHCVPGAAVVVGGGSGVGCIIAAEQLGLTCSFGPQTGCMVLTLSDFFSLCRCSLLTF